MLLVNVRLSNTSTECQYDQLERHWENWRRVSSHVVHDLETLRLLSKRFGILNIEKYGIIYDGGELFEDKLKDMCAEFRTE